MKKIATAVFAFGALCFAAPAFACPHDGAKEKPVETDAPKTADKTKNDKKTPAKKPEKKEKEGAKKETGDKA
jgi:hypothetical protein